MPLATDHRWRGYHGIARYAANVVPSVDLRLLTEPLGCSKSPSVASADGLRLAARRVHSFYSPGFQPLWPTAPGLRQYLTIHDLIHLDDPLESSALKGQYFARVVRPAVRRAGLVFTVSQFSRRRIREWLGDDEFPVVVTGAAPGLGAAGESPSEARAMAPYVLYVGNAKPHKNIALLLAAMDLLDPSLELVWVGAAREEVTRTPTEVLRRRTRFVRGADDVTLASLYAGAAAVAVPSLIEGVGLPALEALACGTSVAYRCDAVAEVVGPFGFRSADPNDPVAFAEVLT